MAVILGCFGGGFWVFLGVFRKKPTLAPNFQENHLQDRPTYQNVSNVMLYHFRTSEIVRVTETRVI